MEVLSDLQDGVCRVCARGGSQLKEKGLEWGIEDG